MNRKKLEQVKTWLANEEKRWSESDFLEMVAQAATELAQERRANDFDDGAPISYQERWENA